MLRVEHKIAFEVIFVMFVLQKINKDRYVDKSPVVCSKGRTFIFWLPGEGWKINRKKKVGKAENTKKKLCASIK